MSLSYKEITNKNIKNKWEEIKDNVTRLDVIKFLFYLNRNEVCVDTTEEISMYLSENGKKSFISDAVSFIFSYDILQDDNYLLHEAVVSRDEEMVKFLLDIGFKLDKESHCKASTTGDINMIKFLDSLDCPKGSESIFNSVINNNIDCLKYNHENGVELTDICIFISIEKRHDEISSYLLNNGCPKNNLIMEKLAHYGDVNMTKIAIENGYDINKYGSNVMLIAISKGHIEYVKYLKSLGIKWDEDSILMASENPDMLSYINENPDH